MAEKDIQDNKKYIFTILKIICLTNIPLLIFIAHDFKSTIGWMTGSFAAAVNFLFLAFHTENMIYQGGKSGGKRARASFLFRYLFLAVWSLFIMMVVKPNIITYCLGLLAAQLSIVIYQIYSWLMNSKYKQYFRGDND